VREGGRLEDPGLDGKLLKRISKNWIRVRGLDSDGLELEQVAGSCKRVNEILGSIK
jgi:hypothetical protein